MTDDQTTPDAEPTEVPAEFVAEMNAITTDLVALDPERRNLLTHSVLNKIEQAIEGAVTHLVAQPETPGDVLRALSIAAASAGFLQILTEQAREEHEDWTRERDSKVDAVWAQFVALLRKHSDGPTGVVGAVQIVPDVDLPRDLMERVSAGNGTEDDYAEVRRVVAEKAGVNPEDVDTDRMFARGPHGETAPVPGQAQQSIGFTPRRDAEGYPVDEDGHRYGGTYL